jgi:prephenate dehydrogenase
MAEQVTITILGLGQIGTSIGLALAESREQVLRIGNDKEPDAWHNAQKVGAVDKVLINLPDAVENADVVILAVPVDELRVTIEAIAPYLKAGSVLLDASPVKTQVTRWVEELVKGEDRYFLTITPAVNPKYLLETDRGWASAQADLFKDSIIMVTSPTGVDESAVNLTENIIRRLGATPLFADSLEVDGLLSSSHLLPELLAIALVNVTTGQPGWSDGRKLAGQTFARMTEPVFFFGEKSKLGQAALHNRDNAVRMIDNLIAELRDLRDEIVEGDADRLHERFDRARKERQTWWAQRLSNKWETKGDKTPPMPTVGESLGRLIGLRPKRDQNANKASSKN